MNDSYLTRQAQFDFDHWSRLAILDPEAFEARRHALIEDLIQRAPPHRQPRLRGLQWRIDRVRERSGTPLAACIRISEMMWESLLGEGGLRDSLLALRDPDSLPRRPRAPVLKLEAARPRRSDLS